jgi:hypothetical protein
MVYQDHSGHGNVNSKMSSQLQLGEKEELVDSNKGCRSKRIIAE